MRYTINDGDGCFYEAYVIDNNGVNGVDRKTPYVIIAECAFRADAQKIADALNEKEQGVATKMANPMGDFGEALIGALGLRGRHVTELAVKCKSGELAEVTIKEVLCEAAGQRYTELLSQYKLVPLVDFQNADVPASLGQPVEGVE